MSNNKRLSWKHGSLFSGIGGFDLAAEWMGWENSFHCEWNSFGQKILKYYWPNAVSYEDITKTDFTFWRGRIDILTGGFPCQPYSTAGKRKGKEDERHLWPEMLRAIREIQPRYVVGENVSGLINWNAGLVFDEVQAELEAEGYKVIPFVLPAAGVGAPHKRERIWFVAYTNPDGSGTNTFGENDEGHSRETPEGTRTENNASISSGNGGDGDVTNTSGEGLPITTRGKQRKVQQEEGIKSGCEFSGAFTTSPGWESFPTQSPVCTGNDGLPAGLDGITISKWRNESIKAGGNAVVPQIPYYIFQAIEQFEVTNPCPRSFSSGVNNKGNANNMEI